MDVLSLIVALAGGIAAGGIFYGGLWWTVRRIPTSDSPARLLILSLLLRLLLALAIFYGVMAFSGHLLYLGLALVVFIVVRTVMIGRVRPREQKQEAAYAVES